MSLEAENIEDVPGGKMLSSHRQRGSDRREQDRRKPGSRVNHAAPRQSTLKVIGAIGVAFSLAVLVLTLGGGEILGLTPSSMLVIFEGLALIMFVLLLALSCIESRLVEIRLELMMLNGGQRAENRREGARRAEDQDA